MDKSLKKTTKNLIIGLLIYEIVLMVVAIFVFKLLKTSLLSLILGVLIGTVLSIFLVIDLARTLDDVLSSNDVAYASRRTMLKAAIRKIVVIVVVVIFYKLEYVNVIAIIVSLFGIKAGAYLHPIISNKTKF